MRYLKLNTNERGIPARACAAGVPSTGSIHVSVGDSTESSSIIFAGSSRPRRNICDLCQMITQVINQFFPLLLDE